VDVSAHVPYISAHVITLAIMFLIAVLLLFEGVNAASKPLVL
jgi:hypothetical protein